MANKITDMLKGVRPRPDDDIARQCENAAMLYAEEQRRIGFAEPLRALPAAVLSGMSMAAGYLQKFPQVTPQMLELAVKEAARRRGMYIKKR